jgi:4-hydroxymandelate oxidase
MSPVPQIAGEPPGRIPPVAELVNAFEIEAIAQRKLDAATFSEIAGGDRRALERITFRPRMMVDTRKLSLTTQIFGQTLFAPILVGPLSEQKRFHPEGELGMARGATKAKAALVLSSRSSVPVEQIAAEAKTPLWYQVYPEADLAALRSRVDHAIGAGCKALCLTLGNPEQAGGADWNFIDGLRKGLGVPVLLKGIMTPEEAQAAAQRGIQGIVVSSYRGHSAGGLAQPIEVLPAIAEAVAGKAAILVDGGFRRGSDVLKALALGAKAVLLGRPALWGLAAYGADGVQAVVELIQTELARDMAMCGRLTVDSLDRSLVTIHKR